MSVKIIADSSCDTTPELREKLNIAFAPLTIRLPDGREFVDVVDFDSAAMLAEMAKFDNLAKSNCPSIDDYAKHMEQYEESVVITLSSKLSGSYNSACAARNMVLEKFPDKKIHVFDSKSASAGQLNLALYVTELNNQGKSFEEIVSLGEQKIKDQNTVFVLENLDNFIKSGRIKKLQAKIASVLKIYPVLHDNDGDIEVDSKIRGLDNAHKRLVELIRLATAKFKEKTVTLSLCYCNNVTRGVKIRTDILEQCSAIKEVILAPTGGLSSMYANSGGVICAF